MPQSHSSARDASGVSLSAYQTLLDVSRMLQGSASIEELLSRLTSELRRIVPYDVLSVYSLDEVRALLVPLHCVDRYAEAARIFLGKEPQQMGWATKVEVPGVMDLITPAAVTAKLDALMRQARRRR